MTWSLQACLSSVQDALPGSLVTPRTFAIMQNRSSVLPDVLSHHFFECRLAHDDHQTDYSGCVSVRDGGRQLLSKYCDDPPVSTVGWDRVNRLFMRWRQPESDLFQKIPLLWLELDEIGEEANYRSSPCVSVCLSNSFADATTGEYLPDPKRQQSYEPWIASIVKTLMGDSAAAMLDSRLNACFKNLPNNAEIIYLAIMLPRSPPAVKISLFLPRQHVIRYLRDINWPASPDALLDILERYCPQQSMLRLDLRISPERPARLDVEFFAKGLPDEVSDRNEFLEKLLQDGLCSSEKGRALQSWTGFEDQILESQTWYSRINRFWFAKLVLEEDKEPQAKAYLGFTPRRLSPFSFPLQAENIV